MFSSLNVHKSGLVFGGTLGLWHLVWSILVALGLAQPLWDFVLKLHMINLTFTIGPFSLARAAGLVVMTAVMGYVVGAVFALLWNKVHK